MQRAERRTGSRRSWPLGTWWVHASRTVGPLMKRSTTRASITDYEPLFGSTDSRMLEAERVLRHYLRADQVNDVVLRSATALDGRNLMQIAEADTDELLFVVRNLFDLHRLDGTTAGDDLGSDVK